MPRSPSPNTIASIKVVVSKDPIQNIKIHEVARAFVNGMGRREAYQSVYKGVKNTSAQTLATRLFKKPFMIDLIKRYYLGETNTKEKPLTKDYAIKVWRHMVECNVLDYMDDDGKCLSVKELKKLHKYVQLSIKKIDIKTEEKKVMLRGKPVLDDDGKPMTELHQHVSIELIDKQRALSDLARAEQWIQTHIDVNVTVPVSADILIAAANKRAKKLRVDDNVIEGEIVNDKEND